MRRRMRVREQTHEEVDLRRLARVLLAAARERQDQTKAVQEQPETKSEVCRGA